MAELIFLKRENSDVMIPELWAAGTQEGRGPWKNAPPSGELSQSLRTSSDGDQDALNDAMNVLARLDPRKVQRF
jgi:hypothetical protein